MPTSLRRVTAQLHFRQDPKLELKSGSVTPSRLTQSLVASLGILGGMNHLGIMDVMIVVSMFLGD